MRNIVTFSPFCVILFELCVAVSLNFCTDLHGKYICCQGYKLDPAQNKCLPCDKGFHGPNCATKCQYPSYGEGCQSICNCNVTHCHHMNGCMQTTEIQIKSTTHLNYRTVTKDQTAIDCISSDKRASNITSDNTTNYSTTFCDTKKRHSKRINTLMFGIIGLAALSFIIYLIYLYTRLLEKTPSEHKQCLVN